jgi:CHASE2 domain-containing sensor protein
MPADAIDWHRTAILAAVVVVGLMGLVVVWKLTKLLLKLAALLVVLGLAAGLVYWWRSTH